MILGLWDSEMKLKKLAIFFSLILISLSTQLLLAAHSQAGSSTFGTTGASPYGIAVDSAGNVYTTNSGSHNVTKITPDGTATVFGNTGSSPYGIAIDAAGNIYTANFASNNVTKITPDGNSTILGSTGVGPFGIALDSVGNVYTANASSGSVSRITPDGTTSIFSTSSISAPRGIFIDSQDNVYVAEYGGSHLVKITPNRVQSNLSAAFNLLFVMSLVVDHQGNIFLAADAGSKISKVTPTGTTTTFASLSSPKAITIDSADNLYVVSGNNIVMITPSGTKTTLGTTTDTPWFVALDPSGNIYTANRNSNTVTKTTPLAPALTLSVASESATAGSPISGFNIASTGGMVHGYSISPAIGNGLTFDSATGLITGTPSQAADPITYSITGTNGGGSYSQTFTISVSAPINPPASINLPIPDPRQLSSLDSITPAMLKAGVAQQITLTGSFIEEVVAIQIDGVNLSGGS
jgi:sugar lactone lactonase YvrE